MASWISPELRATGSLRKLATPVGVMSPSAETPSGRFGTSLSSSWAARRSASARIRSSAPGGTKPYCALKTLSSCSTASSTRRSDSASALARASATRSA
jgi:hypothetical protein